MQWSVRQMPSVTEHTLMYQQLWSILSLQEFTQVILLVSFLQNTSQKTIWEQSKTTQERLQKRCTWLVLWICSMPLRTERYMLLRQTQEHLELYLLYQRFVEFAWFRLLLTSLHQNSQRESLQSLHLERERFHIMELRRLYSRSICSKKLTQFSDQRCVQQVKY